MKRWTHPQDVLALLAGVYAFLSPIWTASTSRASTTMVVLGIITALVALAELARQDLLPLEGLTALLGVLFFISPWVMGFSGMRGMALTAWVVGVITFVVGISDVSLTRTHHHGIAATH